MEQELVWAKMKGYSPWPAYVIKEPNAEMMKKAPKMKNCKCIFFFGSRDFAWIETINLKPYFEFKERLKNNCKHVSFKEAVIRMEEYISDPVKYHENSVCKKNGPNSVRDVDAEFNKLRETDTDTSVVGSEHNDSSIFNNTGDLTDEPPQHKAKPTKTNPARSESKLARKPAAAPKKERVSLPMKFKVASKKARAESDTDEAPNSKRKRAIETPSSVSEHAMDLGYQPSPRRNQAIVTHLLSRPVLTERVETEEMDLNVISAELRARNIKPSGLKFGFLGLGNMGAGMVKNLINTGHTVVVWNRTFSNCMKFQTAGATAVPTPADVIDKVDITFSCVSNPAVAKEMVFGNCGVLAAETLCAHKGYVEMTGIDDSTSQDIADAIVSKGGRYLEAQLQGSKKQSEDGTLIILGAGDRTLYDDCQSCFEAMGKLNFYMGDVGSAAKMYLVLQLISGVQLAALGEAMALASKSGLNQKDVLDVLQHTQMASPMLLEKGKAMLDNNYLTHHPLMHMQKDLRLALTLSESVEQPMPMTAAANEVYKHAKRNGYAEHDASAVYVKSII